MDAEEIRNALLVIKKNCQECKGNCEICILGKGDNSCPLPDKDPLDWFVTEPIKKILL